MKMYRYLWYIISKRNFCHFLATEEIMRIPPVTGGTEDHGSGSVPKRHGSRTSVGLGSRNYFYWLRLRGKSCKSELWLRIRLGSNSYTNVWYVVFTRKVNPNYGCGSDLDPTPTQTYGMSYLPEKYLFTRKIFTFTFNTYSKYKRRKIKPWLFFSKNSSCLW
jgi:hypothetical protein